MTTARSCATCANVDTALRGEDVVMECHLAPPQTMPDAPALPEVATVSVNGEEVELTEYAYAEPHRYPVVTETDWCAAYTPEEAPDGP